MNRRSAWIAAATAVVVLVACGLGWWLLQPGDERDPRPDATPPVVPSTATESAPAMEPAQGPCDGGATKPFTPRQITFDDIVDGAEVIGVPRDSRGVTGVLPISEKADVAWDLDGIRPGERRGNVLLNTHTWPDGSALGNALLDRLRQGGRIVLEGSNGDRLCYEVSRRVEVVASEGYPPYYRDDGPPQVAIIVCSGTRSGAGEWSHRTIWFARALA